MGKYKNSVGYVVYRSPETDKDYAVENPDVLIIEKYFRDCDKFLSAPDELFVDGIPISFERKNGMMNLDFDNKIKIKVKSLIPAWITVSDD